MINTNIGRNLRELRLFREMNEEKFAKMCEVDISTVAKWENEELAPTCQELFVIAKTLRVNMEYFFEELGNAESEWEYTLETCDNVSSSMYLLSEIQWTNVARRILLWRWLREKLLEHKLEKFNTPKYSVKYTTEKQRREVVACFEDLFENEYDEVIKGYVKGENELSKLQDEILRRSEEHRAKERAEKKRCETATWKAYKTCIDYLDKALNNEFVDLRYAAVAVEKLSEYLNEHNDGVNDIILQLVRDALKVSCENNDEENICRVLSFLDKYGEALWSQLQETDRIDIPGDN